MSHKTILQQLFPIQLAGVFEADIEIEGKHLDDALDKAALLIAEMYADTCSDTIEDWERVCGVTPGESDTLQIRRNRVVAKLMATGRLDKQYFIDLAAALGTTITIDELDAGDDGYGDEGIWAWRVNVTDQESTTTYFRAGDSVAGDYLMSWVDDLGLEELFNELKPAHTQCLFAYPEE